MHPVIVKLGWFNIYSFGFMLAVSFLIGIYLASYRARRYGVNPQYILDLSVYVILAAVVGSRLLYIAFHIDEYRNIIDVFALWQGGATLYGGLLLAIFASYAFCRRKGISFLLVADVVSPSLALGFMMTRVGCFLGGCCFGKPTTLPWGVVFPPQSAAGAYARQIGESFSAGVAHLHPTQLYESFYGLVIFLVLIVFDKRLMKLGKSFGTFLVLYGIFRFANDSLRYYETNMIAFMDLTWNQIMSAGLVLCGAYLLFRKAALKTRLSSA